MSRTRYRVFETDYPYFLTCTVVAWLPVFTRSQTVDIVLDSWRFLQTNQRLAIYGYVVLENHLHLIARSPNLEKEIGDFKSFTARKIIDLLHIHQAGTLLEQLKWHKARHKKDQEHQLWQEGSHPKQIANEDVMRQKLEYVHNNPVKRGYVDDPVHWRYSSARNYAGLPGLIDVITNW
ncbi:MAG: transposase [Acidobacteria bacterium]|nr:transposase [Acidobacteriota bacterium]